MAHSIRKPASTAQRPGKSAQPGPDERPLCFLRAESPHRKRDAIQTEPTTNKDNAHVDRRPHRSAQARVHPRTDPRCPRRTLESARVRCESPGFPRPDPGAAQAARWAPSCFGDEPWRYILWDRSTDEQAWQTAFDCLTPGNQAWCRNVPLLMVSIASAVFDQSGKTNRWAQHDTGAASENLVLQAVALGLAAHQMGGFDADKLKHAFGIPGEYTPMAMIAIGYQAPADILAEEQRQKELGPRARKPPETRFFSGAWGVCE